MPRLRSRLPASLYVAGPFAMGYTEFYNFLIPLYGLRLGMSAGAIGMLVGARSLLAVFLSIHVGVLMDRLGTRRVTLFFVWTAMTVAPVFPLLPPPRPLLSMRPLQISRKRMCWSCLLLLRLSGPNPSDAVVRKERFIVRPIDRGGRIVGRAILNFLAVDIEVN